ncbi:MAG: alpha/beta fold hydrolase [Deltaproteobacteria bacterium]|nr:alpha/beta fold hydrolase [Deltaproteobacteria bacterium]
MGLGAAEVGKLRRELRRMGAGRGTRVRHETGPRLVPPPRAPRPLVIPMPEANVRGPGRNRAFQLPQYFAIANGLRTAFCDAGRGDPVVLIHGLAGDLTHWVYVAPRLAAGHRVLALDLAACGESERPREPLSVKLYAEQVRSLLDVVGLERAALVGHSLGGMVAAELALAAPERVSKLVLINPAGFQKMPLLLRAAGHAFLREPVLSTLLPPLWKKVLDVVFCEKNEHTRGFVESVESTYRVDDIHALSAVIASLKQDFLERNFLAALDRLTVPTLLMWGAKDLLTPAKELRETASRLPNVTTHEIPRCGHMPLIERPELTVDLIRSHLAA